MRKTHSHNPALLLSFLLSVSPALRAEPFCKEESGPIRVESTAPDAQVFIDDVPVGKTPWSGTAAIDNEKKTKAEAWGAVGSFLGGVVFGTLGAVTGIMSGSPVKEAVDGFKSGATKDVHYCEKRKTAHTVKVIHSSLTYTAEIADANSFGTVSADLSGIGFEQGNTARAGGDLMKARDLFRVVESFGGKEAEEAGRLAGEIDALFAKEARRAEEVKRALETGRALAGSENPESLAKAVAEFKKAEELDPKSKAREEREAALQKLHDAYAAKASAALKKGRYYQAVLALRAALSHLDVPATREALESAIAAHKETAGEPGYDLWVTGVARLEAGKPEAAARLFERAHREAPKDAAYLNALGAAFFDAGRYGEARELFLEALAIDPKAVWYYYLGRTELELFWLAENDSERETARLAAKDAFAKGVARARKPAWVEEMRKITPVLTGLTESRRRVDALSQEGNFREAVSELERILAYYRFQGSEDELADLKADSRGQQRREAFSGRYFRVAASTTALLALLLAGALGYLLWYRRGSPKA